MKRAFKRAFRLDRRSRADARSAVDEELAHHLELCVEELVDEGWSPEEARQEAARRFGDLEDTRTYCSTIQSRRGRVDERTRVIDETWQDLKYAIRGVAKAPGYAGLVVLTLAFGIAANTVIFSLMNPYFFRTLPFGDAEELAHITQVDPINGWDMDRMSLPIYEDWAERSQGLEGLAAYTYRGTNVTGAEGAEGVNISPVSANLLDVLQVQPALGRGFRPEDGGPGAEPVVLLDHGFWERRYLGDPGVVGRAITLDGEPHTVIGVMPPDFAFPFNRVVMWTPIRESAAGVDRGGRTPYLLVGRLAPGWTRERLDTELTRVQTELAQEYPDADGQWAGVTVLPIRQALNFAWDILALTFSIMLGAVIFVLAIACVNVASLTLARASTRTRDLSVRVAMGASRGRVVRQLLTESTVLAVAGGALGVALAWWIVGMVGPVLPPDLFRVGDVELDTTVLAFTMVVTLATPLLFGLVPALKAVRKDLVAGLKEGSKASGSAASTRGRRILVTVQVALAVVLLAGAGLMIRSFAAVQDLELGFDADRILYVQVTPPESEYDLEGVHAFTRQAVERLEAVPGVVSASSTMYLPLNNETATRQYTTPEQSGTPGEQWPLAILNRSWPGYFETLGIPLLSGRTFLDSDDDEAPRVVVVNQALAERAWPGADPVGRTLLIGDPAAPTEATVVGVVGAVRHRDLTQGSPGPQLYRPFLQTGSRRQFLLARTEGDPTVLAAQVRRTLAEIDPDIPVTVHAMDEVIQQSQMQWSLGSLFLGIFGGGALLLAALGIYGLISFSVSQRSREMAVRIALGASGGDIRTEVLRDGVMLTSVGLGIGLVVALGMGQVIASALYGVSPFDPLTLGGILVLFLGIAAVASLVPATRASRTEPVKILRSE